MRFLTFVILLLAGAGTQAQSGPTYRQLAVESRGTVSATVGIGCGWVGPPLASIVQFADIAVEGIVLNKRTYATNDDRSIFTEYEIATRQVLYQRVTQTASKPGPPPPIIFKALGGTVVFDGYPFTLSGGPRTQLDVGSHVILFGRYDKSDGKWLFGDRSVFHIAENIVLNWLPTLEGVPEGLEPRMALAAFTQKVRNLAR
jgi:hypothetical protein